MAGCAGVQCGVAQGRSVGLRRGEARGCGGEQRGVARGRNSVGPRKGAAARAVQGRSSVGLCRGVAAWAQQPGAAQWRSSAGLRWSTAWGYAGAQQRGAA